MQQSGAAEVRILTENVYKFHVLGGSKLIREFSDKGCNVKSLNKLLMKERHSGSMTRQTRSGRRRCMRSDASLVLQGTVRTYRTRYELSMYMYLFQISWGTFMPKISRIG